MHPTCHAADGLVAAAGVPHVHRVVVGTADQPLSLAALQHLLIPLQGVSLGCGEGNRHLDTDCGEERRLFGIVVG